MSLIQCRACEATIDVSSPRVQVPEMMFGSRDPFLYTVCRACECLQICTPPTDLSLYYPPSYYSFDAPGHGNVLRRTFRNARNRYALTGSGYMGRILGSVLPFPYPDVRTALGMVGKHGATRILDVGCGAGWLLRDLRSAGFEHTLGIDPFLDRDTTSEGGVRVLRRSIQELDGSFDLIMFHHVLEHVPDQIATINSVGQHLEPGGVCLIRIPLASSYAWERYQEHWVQIDAPRHFVLHTARSIEALAARAGLRLVLVRYDSTAFQFTGSELYKRGIPLVEMDGQFTRRELRRYGRLAQRLNAEGRGDQAAFIFRKE